MCEETFAISSSNNRWGGRTERKRIIKGKKKSHYSRGIADFRSAQTPGDWITFFISLLRAEDITKLKTLYSHLNLVVIYNGGDSRRSGWKTMRVKNGEIDGKEWRSDGGALPVRASLLYLFARA